MSTFDEARLGWIKEIQEECMAAIARGQMQITMKLDALTWINIIDELADRHPRNYSQLLRDDMMQRLEGAIERLHEEANFLIAHHPAAVAARFDPSRERKKRAVISDELARQIRGGPDHDRPR